MSKPRQKYTAAYATLAVMIVAVVVWFVLKGRKTLGGFDDDLGPKYTQFKGKPKEAIKYLMKVKKGQAIAALYRDEIGEIDIVWGKGEGKPDDYGLAHIFQKHGKEIAQLGFKIEDFIPIVVLLGNFKVSDDGEKVFFNGERFSVVVRMDYNRNKKNWILTAFDTRPIEQKKPLGAVESAVANNFTQGTMPQGTSGFGTDVSQAFWWQKAPQLNGQTASSTSLGQIYEEIPEKVYPCNDGTYSSHNRRGACNWHGGLADKEPVSFFENSGTEALDVADLKDVYAIWQNVAEINTDPNRFQNRDDDFSEESVERIVNNYDPNRLDPVTVWRDTSGKIWMLSGHSRLEAHKRLQMEKIPARFFRGTEQEAIDFARFYANRGATPEKLTEDIKIFRQLRDVEKLPVAELRARFEGQYNALENYSYLNPSGDFIRYLSLPKNQRDQFPLLEVKSGWVGLLRKQLPQLTNSHEQEMWDYLYRSQAGGKLRKEEFLQKVQDIAMRLDFTPERPLRLESQGETGIYARADTEESAKRVREIDAAIRNYSNILKTDRKADKEGINRMIAKLLREKEYLQKGVSEMMKTQTSLFGFTLA